MVNVLSSQKLLLILPSYLLWFVVFRMDFLNFWARMLLAVSLLILIAFIGRSELLKSCPRFQAFTMLLGVILGFLLYWLLYFGYVVFEPFITKGAEEIYALRYEAPLTFIALSLIFTSFGEEGLLERVHTARASKKVGRYEGKDFSFHKIGWSWV